MKRNLFVLLMVAWAATYFSLSANAQTTEMVFYNVVLEDCGSDKLAVVDVLREKLGLSLKAAKELADSAPCTIAENMLDVDAYSLKNALEAAGATVTLELLGVYDSCHRYDVVLESLNNSKVAIISVLMDELDMTMTEAKTLVESGLPVVVLDAAPMTAALRLANKIRAAGGTVSVAVNTKVTVICEETFPDEQFRNYVSSSFDLDQDGALSMLEKRVVTEINLGDEDIRATTLEGSEVFVNLKKLNCHYSLYIEELDLSCFPDLEYLDCGVNDLTSLDVSHNPKLTYLNCAANKLTGTLYLNGNPELTYLNCQQNELSAIEAQMCTKMETFNCYDNEVEQLSLSTFANLTDLWCSSNRISSLSLLSNENLEVLRCDDNQLTSLNVGRNTKLKKLSVSGNNITSLGLSSNPDIENLDCSGLSLGILNISHLSKLVYLDCSDCGLTALALDGKPNMETLIIDGNKVRSINVSKMNNLDYLSCVGCGLTSLNLKNNTLLTYLNCSNNQLTDIQLTSLSNLNDLNLSRNKIGDENMSKIFNLLPVREKMWVSGDFFEEEEETGYWEYMCNIYVIDESEGDEENVCSARTVSKANAKGWQCLAISDFFSYWEPYPGSDAEIATTVDAFTVAADAPRHNLHGQRVDRAYKGIVIVDGKKVFKR